MRGFVTPLGRSGFPNRGIKDQGGTVEATLLHCRSRERMCKRCGYPGNVEADQSQMGFALGCLTRVETESRTVLDCMSEICRMSTNCCAGAKTWLGKFQQLSARTVRETESTERINESTLLRVLEFPIAIRIVFLGNPPPLIALLYHRNHFPLSLFLSRPFSTGFT